MRLNAEITYRFFYSVRIFLRITSSRLLKLEVFLQAKSGDFMKRFFTTISAMLICTFIGFSSANGQIATWDFTGNNTANSTFAATGFDSRLSSASGLSNITRGSGASAIAENNCFSTNGFQNNGIATTNTDYFQVTLRPTGSILLSVSNINAKLAGTSAFAAAPGVTTQFAYSVDGVNFTLIETPQVHIGSPQTLVEIGTSGILALQNIPSTQTVTLRLYVSGQTTTGTWGLCSPSAGSAGLAIEGILTPLDITTQNVMPLGYLSVPFSRPFATIGGTAPYTYTFVGGQLPPGLTLTPTGILTGIPTEAGAYPFDILVVDSLGNRKIESFHLPIKGPTAADSSIRGRVITPSGRGLSNAFVNLINTTTGETRLAKTTTFGYFNFQQLETGDFYVISVKSKRYYFESRSFTLNDNIEDLVLTGQ
jgi:Putative Ig domain/Carboxypeptidase regulatory-like domain